MFCSSLGREVEKQCGTHTFSASLREATPAPLFYEFMTFRTPLRKLHTKDWEMDYPIATFLLWINCAVSWVLNFLSNGVFNERYIQTVSKEPSANFLWSIFVEKKSIEQKLCWKTGSNFQKAKREGRNVSGVLNYLSIGFFWMKDKLRRIPKSHQRIFSDGFTLRKNEMSKKYVEELAWLSKKQKLRSAPFPAF